MRNRFLYEFGARGIFPTGCLELGLIVDTNPNQA